MKLCLIPPKGLEYTALRSSHHLTLPIRECIENPVYVVTYATSVRRRLYNYVILDNGAADGGLVSNQKLFEVAELLNADEIVVPDVLRSKAGTLAKVRKFLAHAPTSYNYMAVVQGTTTRLLHSCVAALAEVPSVRALGIPRHLLERHGHAVRINLANWIAEKFPGRFVLHFLGTNPLWIQEVKHAEVDCPHVRSVDTSMPYNYTIAGYELTPNLRIEVMRPSQYFTQDWYTRIGHSLLRNNISVLQEWVGDTDV